MVTLMLTVTPILIAILRLLVDDFGIFPRLKSVIKHIVLVERVLYLAIFLTIHVVPMYLETSIIEVINVITII